MTPEERTKFLQDHRLCVVGYDRDDGPPALSPVYYVMDGDDIVISTTRTRAKARAAMRDAARMSVCVLGEAMPFPYLTVYGRCRIEDEGTVDVMMKVGGRMSGNPLPESARPAVEKRAQEEDRVVLRITPESYVP